MLQTLSSRRADPAGPALPVTGAFKVDISRGERLGRVSSEWFSRPDDKRYLSLTELHATVRGRADRATARTVETKALRVEASRDDAQRLTLVVPGRAEPVAPTHWSYGQLCSLVGAPASYMRQLPAPLAGINLQHGLLSHRAELVKTLEADDGRVELRAVTGPDYGRIWDHELVEAVMRIAGNGTGDTRWKVPGLLDWSTMTHNPFVEVTKDTTTLYASDRDVFLFLVDDAHPIEAGRLPNGDPDLYFRGFYCWNSEFGSKTLGIASFYLRAVCMNRNIWGAEGFEEISIRHSKFAGHRFAHQAAPALERFADSSPMSFMAGVRAAREATIPYGDYGPVERGEITSAERHRRDRAAVGPAAVMAAAIPVERSRARLLLISGGRDAVWPSDAMSAEIVRRMAAHDSIGRATWRSFPDAGHYLCGTGSAPIRANESDEAALGGGLAPADGRDPGRAWEATMAFLRKALGP